MTKKRCAWCEKTDLYKDYHDNEWGKPVYDDATLFEFLILETFQAGLSWYTIHRLQHDDLTPFAGIPGKYRNGQNPTGSDYNIGTPYVIKSTDVPAIPYADYKYVWPIPTLETSANPVLAAQQNPGY